MKALTTLLVVGMFLMPAALADDADDVRAAEIAHITARNTGNVNAWVQHHSAERKGFGPEGGLLGGASLEQQRIAGQASVDAGVKRNVQPRHFEVQIYGNTAVTTCYTMGTVTQPDGTVERIANRRTAVLTKQGGQWKEVHFHVSPLSFPQ